MRFGAMALQRGVRTGHGKSRGRGTTLASTDVQRRDAFVQRSGSPLTGQNPRLRGTGARMSNVGRLAFKPFPGRCPQYSGSRLAPLARQERRSAMTNHDQRINWIALDAGGTMTDAVIVDPD